MSTKTIEQKQAILDKIDGLKTEIGTEAACKKVGIPSSTYYNYRAEIKRKAGGTKVVTYSGSSPKKGYTRVKSGGQVSLIVGSIEQITEVLRGLK